MKKLLTTLLALFMVLSLTACGNKAESTVKTFLDNCKKGNLEEFFVDEDELSEEEYGEFLKALLQHMDYKIEKSEKISDDEYIVTTTITTIDMSTAFTDIFTSYFNWAVTQAMSGTEVSDEELTAKFKELLNQAIEDNKDTTKSFTVDIKVEKNDEGKWEIDMEETLVDALTGGFISSASNFSLDE